MIKDLLNFFESYYGEKYTGMFLDIMLDYLKDGSDEFLLAVRKVMVLRFSRIYNKVPCPADIEKNMDEILSVISYPAALPEPQTEKASPEEAQEWLKDIKGILSKGKGPLAGVMAEAIGGKV